MVNHLCDKDNFPPEQMKRFPALNPASNPTFSCYISHRTRFQVLDVFPVYTP